MHLWVNILKLGYVLFVWQDFAQGSRCMYLSAQMTHLLLLLNFTRVDKLFKLTHTGLWKHLHIWLKVDYVSIVFKGSKACCFQKWRFLAVAPLSTMSLVICLCPCKTLNLHGEPVSGKKPDTYYEWHTWVGGSDLWVRHTYCCWIHPRTLD